MNEQEKEQLIMSAIDNFPRGLNSLNLLGNQEFINWLIPLTSALRESDFWPHERILRMQTVCFNNLFKYLAGSSQFWSNYFQKYNFQIDSPLTLTDLKKLPIVDKEIIIRQRKEWIVSRQNGTDEKIHLFTTSGTTGVVLPIVAGDRELITGMLPSFFRNPVFTENLLRDLLARKFILDFGRGTVAHFRSFADAFVLDNFTPLAKKEVRRQIYEKIISMAPVMIRGHASVILELTRYVEEDGVSLPFFAVNLNGEGLAYDEKLFIRNTFKVPILQRYTSREAGMIGSECPVHFGKGYYHLHRERIIVEIIDENGKHVKKGETGEIVLTILDRKIMPIIRYAIKDRGRIVTKECVCGRKSPLLELEGRSKDLIILPGGKTFSFLLFRVMFIADADLRKRIKQFQIVQETSDHLKITIVAEPLFNEKEKRILSMKFSYLLDNTIKVSIEQVKRIETSYGEKSNAFISLSEARGEKDRS